jgi:hypothetical protein
LRGDGFQNFGIQIASQFICGFIDVWRHNHVLSFCTNIYCYYKELTLGRPLERWSEAVTGHLAYYLMMKKKKIKNLRTSFLQQLKHTLNIPVCFAFVSLCIVALRTMEIPPLLYSLPNLESESYYDRRSVGQSILE